MTKRTTKTKVCPGYGREGHEEPLQRFAKNAARKDGLSRLCRETGA
jgi:hypothetical protein